MKKSVIFLIIIVLAFIFLLKGENVFFTALMPFQQFLYGGNDSENNLIQQIESAQIDMYKNENEVLRKHLNFLEISHDNFIIANVIGKRYELGSEWFLLNKGIRDGLKKGFAIVDENGILIGTIAKTENIISYMKPIFDRHSSIAVDILSEDSEDISGIISGEYGLSIKMKYIPIDKQINIGDTIITSGLDKNVRRGIIIGEIAEVDKNPNAIFQNAIIRPFFNPNFRTVSILIPND